MALRDAMQQVQEARDAYRLKRYTEAVEHYRNALAVIPDAPETEKQVKFIKDSLSDALIARAMDYRAVGRYDEAVEFLKEAIKLSPDNKRARQELAETNDPVRHNPALTPEHVGDVEEVQRRLTLGYGYLDLGKYDEAYRTFDDVLRIDPYNSAARRGQEAVARRKSGYYNDARNARRSEALAAVDAQWEELVPEDASTVSQLAGTETAGAAAYSEDPEVEKRISEALKEMRLAQISFEDASIMEVLDALRGQIRHSEANNLPAGRHINISSNFGQQGTPGYERIMAQRVNLTLADVSMTDVLDVLARQLGITYYITPIGVEVCYSGRDFGPMTERIYTVAPHFFDMEKEEGEDEEEDEWGSGGSSSRMVVKRVNPKEALTAMGISFPEGSRVQYDTASRRLRVYNTVYNLQEIEEILNTPIDKVERSVVLNIMAVEVTQEDLEELGFEWLLNFSLDPSGALYGSGGVQNTVSSITGLPMVETGVTSELNNSGIKTGEMTKGLRSNVRAISTSNIENLIRTGSAQAYGLMKSMRTKAPGIFSFRGIWNSGDLTMIMRGLSQKKGADVLYNPRLVFTPGRDEQVVFTNVREMFYPLSYSEPQVSSMSLNLPGNDNGFNNEGSTGYASVAVGAHPDEFTRFGMTEDSVGGIGTVVQVHNAEVLEDDCVSLALTVTLNEFQGFINWGTPIESYQWLPGDTSGLRKITLSPNYILRPVFKQSMENTSVTVAPGSVLVMGGLQEAHKVKFEDKLPVLGDLPLIGRLFRSEGEEELRKAFLVFVRVDLVDPTGRDAVTRERPTASD